MEEKVMIFIDGSNLFRGLRDDYPEVKVDYEKLQSVLVGKRHLIQTYYFCSRPVPPKAAQEGFYKYLQELGFTVEIIDLKYYAGRPKEKGVDTSLVIESLVHAFNQNYDVGIIVGGDEDYLKLINEIKRLGPKIEVAAFKNSMSGKLRRSGIKFIELDKYVDKIKK